MKNRAKKRILTMIAAVMLCMAAFPLTAYAGGGDESEPEPPTEAAVPEVTPEPSPFTPDGTGTVVDHATDEDGKEFYTIITADENYFYLIIDHQRDTDNVYFLNVVTEQDLMALAEVSSDTGGVSAIPDTTTPAPEPSPEPEPTPEPEAEPEQGGNMGMVIVVVLVVLAGGGAAYYFKIYRPKQEQAGMDEDFEEYEDNAPWPDDEDAPPWDEDEEEPDIDYIDEDSEA